MIILESGWIINFNDGFIIAFSEEKYKEYTKTHDKNDVLSEEHWFNIKDGMKQKGLKELHLAKGEK